MPPKKGKAKGGSGGEGATAKATATPVATGQAVADPPPEMEEAEEEDESSTDQKNLREGSDVSRVTDFVEQKELDSAKASKALASITAEDTVDREAEREREKELAAVQINQVGVRPPPFARTHRGTRRGTCCESCPVA